MVTKIASFGKVAIGFMIFWVMAVATWILFGILQGGVDISATEAGIITGILALPIALTPYVDKLFPRKEANDVRDTDTS